MPVSDQIRVCQGQTAGVLFFAPAAKRASAAPAAAVHRRFPLMPGAAYPPDLPAGAGSQIAGLHAEVFGGMPLFDKVGAEGQKVVMR